MLLLLGRAAHVGGDEGRPRLELCQVHQQRREVSDLDGRRAVQVVPVLLHLGLPAHVLLRAAPHALQGAQPRQPGLGLGPVHLLPGLHARVLLLQSRLVLRVGLSAHVHVLRDHLLPGPRGLLDALPHDGPLQPRRRRVRQPAHPVQQLHPDPLVLLPHPGHLRPQLPRARSDHRPDRGHRVLHDGGVHDGAGRLRDQVPRGARGAAADDAARRGGRGEPDGRRGPRADRDGLRRPPRLRRAARGRRHDALGSGRVLLCVGLLSLRQARSYVGTAVVLWCLRQYSWCLLLYRPCNCASDHRCASWLVGSPDLSFLDGEILTTTTVVVRRGRPLVVAEVSASSSLGPLVRESPLCAGSLSVRDLPVGVAPWCCSPFLVVVVPSSCP
mmetsp:Transcript_6379/g.26816  ORF Transcript_6379/g.26816 Transcript_6379/m.26816 type:complete len:385 (-) Transcript_6379:138-1292(-)